MSSFTAENFVNAIGGPEKLQEICIDKGSNFLTGKVTTGFQKVMTAETKTWTVITKFEGKKDIEKVFVEKDQAENYKNAQENDLRVGDDNAKAKGRPAQKWSVEMKEGTVPNAPANITGMASNALGMMGALTVGPEVVNALIMESTNVVASKMQEYTAKITATPIQAALAMPKKLKEEMQKTFDEKKTTLAKEMEKFNVNSEELIEKEQAKIDGEIEKLQQSKLASQISSLNKSMAKVTSQINKKMSSITKYVAEGPQWVSNQISKTIDEQFSILDQQVENTRNDINTYISDFAEGQGKNAGEKLAAQYNKIIANTAKKTHNMIEESKSKAAIKAFTGLQKAKLKIMALTGVNIPA